MEKFLPAWTMIPFCLMLTSIAIMPLVASDFWQNNRNKLIVALILSIPVIIYLLIFGMVNELFNTMVYDYIPFIILLGSLFTITGGIHIDGDIEAKPKINVFFLLIGAILASVMGTTGAAILLIRPILNTNKERDYKVHTVLFFIAIVANCGGLLTPIGDPPLFMMYLRGVPFFWFLKLLPEWLFVNGLLLIIYYFVDSYYWKKETIINKVLDKLIIKRIKISGKINFVFLIGVVLAVAVINTNTFSFIKAGTLTSFSREFVIILMAMLSLIYTSKKIRLDNLFIWHPIQEVAYLFLGIFITMVPCIIFLENHADQIGIKTPTLFYYSTGAISSFLDNTPTAVTFYSLALGLVQKNMALFTGASTVAGIPEIFIRAISSGAVIFGSMTYIGNGPNFMVKSIAEQYGINMPHFFAYMYKFSLIILLPIFILNELLFL